MRMPPIKLFPSCALACALALAPALAGAASVYKRAMPDGSVVYSDQPHPDAEAVEFEPTPTIEPFRARPAPPPRATGAAVAPAYERVAITQPVDDEVIWSNEGIVEADVTTAPGVRAVDGHRLVLLMDGNPVARSERGGRFVLQDVHRGTHVLQVVVEDRGGTTIARSDPVTFHLRQHSVLAPGNPLRRPPGPGLPGRPPGP